jgi:hypothetical protein
MGILRTWTLLVASTFIFGIKQRQMYFASKPMRLCGDRLPPLLGLAAKNEYCNQSAKLAAESCNWAHDGTPYILKTKDLLSKIRAANEVHQAVWPKTWDLAEKRCHNLRTSFLNI